MTRIKTETPKWVMWVICSLLTKQGGFGVCVWVEVPSWLRSNWSWQSSLLRWLKRPITVQVVSKGANERVNEWERKCCHCSTISSSPHSSKCWTSMATCSIFWLTEPLLTALFSSLLLCTRHLHISFLSSHKPPAPFSFHQHVPGTVLYLQLRISTLVPGLRAKT